MKIPDMHGLFSRAQPDIIRRSIGDARFHSPSRQPYRVAPGIVIATGSLFAHRHPAEFATPDDQSIIP